MVFSSLPFLFLFMPLSFICYFIVPKKFKNITLLLFSLIFYAWGEPIYIILMIFTSLVNYLAGRLMDKYKTKRKTILVGSIAISLGLLGFYKYGNFFIENINQLFSLSIPALSLALPIGISFYTFQALSYTVDVYRKEVPSEKSFLNFMTYISMFPQLIAGPIVRYQTIAEELDNRTINVEKFSTGLLRFLRGLGKKVLLANSIGLLWTAVQNSTDPSIMMNWLGLIAFAFQIYFDFSGYSDMGIGMGKMLGFNFLENFNHPYIAKSITDFWRRWHISLSTFFKDYVYIPLGGNRCRLLKNIRNILIVWMLTGFWHGAAWNFLLWGLYYGILLIIEKFVLKKVLDKLPSFIQHIYAIFFILIGWFIFAFDDMNSLMQFGTSLFQGTLWNQETLYLLQNFALLLVICGLLSTPFCSIISQKLAAIKNKKMELITAFGSLILYSIIFFLAIAYLVDSAYNPFLYFRF